MLAAAAAAFALLATGEAFRWSADADAQARGRSERNGAETAEVSELSLSSRFGLLFRHPDGTAALTWTPRVLLRQAISGQPAGTGDSTQQGGRLDLETRLTPTTRLASRSGFDWGLTDFSPLAGRPIAVAGTGILPNERFVRTLALDSSLELRHRFSRQLELVAAGGFQRSGGLGSRAVQVLPMQTGAVESLALSWGLDRNQALTLQASGAQTRFSLGRTSQLTESQMAWSGRTSAQVTLEAGAGLAVIRSEGSDGAQASAYGSAAAGARWDAPLSTSASLSTSLRARLSPGIDRITGQAVENVRGEGAAALAAGRFRFALGSSGGRAVSGAFDGAEDVRFDARASLSLGRGTSADAAYGAAWTNQAPIAGWQNQLYFGIRWSGAGAL